MRTPRALRFLATLSLVAAACGTSSPSGQVFDFADIAAGEAIMTPAPSGSTATLTVDTTIDAVCAVAYGETAELGQLATDQDMGAAGHSDHSALLTGLRPGTEYFYRLQGVTGDGRVFQGELLTFSYSTG